MGATIKAYLVEERKFERGYGSRVEDLLDNKMTFIK